MKRNDVSDKVSQGGASQKIQIALRLDKVDNKEVVDALGKFQRNYSLTAQSIILRLLKGWVDGGCELNFSPVKEIPSINHPSTVNNKPTGVPDFEEV